MDQLGIQHLWTSVLNLLYPPRCVGCQELGAWFCADCAARTAPVEPPLCGRCGDPLPAISASPLCRTCRSTPPKIDRIRSVVYSEGALSEAIHAFKYDGVTALAAPLGRLMADYWSAYPMPVDVVVPVPLHRHRLRRRGFNQAALLAREFSRATGLTVDQDVLVRHRATAAQVGLDTDQRRENVRDAFRCISPGVADQRVLLIDDVCTTGSTLEACAVALRQGGAESVQALTLARARPTAGFEGRSSYRNYPVRR